MQVGGPFERVTTDRAGPFKETHDSNRYIPTFQCARTKWPLAKALQSQDSHQVARAFFDMVICERGLPRTLLSDRGKSFLSKLMQSLYKLWGIKKLSTSSYHPETNGLQERHHSVLVTSLSFYVDRFQET